ncbi:MAG: hypothetical protein LBT13_02040, partial [Treponema sp.]|nr:hypothetical protein [Treponema sp.]
MKRFFLGVSLLVLAVLFFSCPIEVKEDTVITIQAISLNMPATGQMPVTQIQPTEQYTGTVSWQDGAGHTPNQFSADTVYTATITLAPQSGYTL